jgi:hypothetical protein
MKSPVTMLLQSVASSRRLMLYSVRVLSARFGGRYGDGDMRPRY